MCKKALCLLLLLCMLPLGGCWDAQEVNQQIFVLNMALDKGQAHALRLTVQLPMVGKGGSGGSSSGGGDSSSGSSQPKGVDQKLIQNGYVLTQTEGDSINECLTTLYAALPRHLSFLQVRGLFFSETLAGSDELFDALSPLMQARLVRSSAPVFLCRGRAEDVIGMLNPSFGTRMSKTMLSRLDTLEEQSIIPETTLSAFYSHMMDSGADPLAVTAAVNAMNYVEKTPPKQGDQGTDYLAGELPHNSIHPVDFYGAAVFDGTRVKLLLDGYETQLLNLCMGSFKRGDLIVMDKTVPVTLALTEDKPPQIKVDVQGAGKKTPLITVILYTQGSPYAELFVEDQALLAERAATQLKDDVTELLLKLQQHNCDPLDLCGWARRHTLTNKEWNELNWESMYPNACFAVDVRFTLRNNATTISAG